MEEEDRVAERRDRKRCSLGDESDDRWTQCLLQTTSIHSLHGSAKFVNIKIDLHLEEVVPIPTTQGDELELEDVDVDALVAAKSL